MNLIRYLTAIKWALLLGLFYAAALYLGGYVLFYQGPVWGVWPMVSIVFGVWTAFSVYVAVLAIGPIEN